MVVEQDGGRGHRLLRPLTVGGRLEEGGRDLKVGGLAALGQAGGRGVGVFRAARGRGGRGGESPFGNLEARGEKSWLAIVRERTSTDGKMDHLSLTRFQANICLCDCSPNRKKIVSYLKLVPSFAFAPRGLISGALRSHQILFLISPLRPPLCLTERGKIRFDELFHGKKWQIFG